MTDATVLALRTEAEKLYAESRQHESRAQSAREEGDKFARLAEAKQREVNAQIPVDRSQRTLADGSPITDDHRELKPNGQQKDYIVLSEEERARGYVRPVRDAYRHLKCGKITTMSRSIAETYARDPSFYSGTFCTTCRGHFPVGEAGEFTWYENDGSEGPKVGT